MGDESEDAERQDDEDAGDAALIEELRCAGQALDPVPEHVALAAKNSLRARARSRVVDEEQSSRPGLRLLGWFRRVR